MIFIHNETGELYELLICSLDDSSPETYNNKWRVGTIALAGEIDPEIKQYYEIVEKMTFIGFI